MLERHGALDSPLPGPLQQGGGAMTDSTTASVVSRDGTQITYDRLGFGPPLVVVAGALGLRKSSFVRRWGKALAEHFTVSNYDRRGRGASGDATRYTVKPETHDLRALAQ